MNNDLAEAIYIVILEISTGKMRRGIRPIYVSVRNILHEYNIRYEDVKIGLEILLENNKIDAYRGINDIFYLPKGVKHSDL